jgi:hypothetical protein
MKAKFVQRRFLPDILPNDPYRERNSRQRASFNRTGKYPDPREQVFFIVFSYLYLFFKKPVNLGDLHFEVCFFRVRKPYKIFFIIFF